MGGTTERSSTGGRSKCNKFKEERYNEETEGCGTGREAEPEPR
jgi:hypothetical protein